ncbi:HAD family hydrolase [Streptomyces sp. DSM 42041]|uniref:HAD family hydrolase n=1 Tax=Streptomyces hazeniae TaxID=3075538 RepID=A0ABU2NRA1_9ACTN|nr:HAD family hydrolase [Streptomyces sp. DSM 42041]MDT0378153.1 HAD family hydrolase [Streptomyces sp. DSM 42041]
MNAAKGTSPRAVLFDVDGTLVDTNYLHAVTWWEAFRQAGHTVPMPDIHRSVGMGADRLIGHLLGDERDRDQDARISTAHKVLYAEYFPKLAALPGAAGLLRAVAGKGLRVVLASSAGGEELAAMRAAIDADDVIAAATGGDDVEATKPAADLVEQALRRAGVPADEAVFVGDTVWDMRACGKAGVTGVAVRSGGIAEEELIEAGAMAVYEGPADLLAALERSPLVGPGA